MTYTLKDFPEYAIARHGIAARHPDGFLSEMYLTTAAEFLEAIDRLLGRLRNPVTTRQASSNHGSLAQARIVHALLPYEEIVLRVS